MNIGKSLQIKILKKVNTYIIMVKRNVHHLQIQVDFNIITEMTLLVISVYYYR